MKAGGGSATLAKMCLAATVLGPLASPVAAGAAEDFALWRPPDGSNPLEGLLSGEEGRSLGWSAPRWIPRHVGSPAHLATKRVDALSNAGRRIG